MRWPAVLGVSVAAHAAVIAALPGTPARAIVPTPTPVVTLEPSAPPMEITPFEVVVLPERSVAPTDLPPDRSIPPIAPPIGRSHRSVRASTQGAAAEVAATEAATATGSRFATMRFQGAETAEAAPQELDFSLPVSMIAAILDKPSPEVPPPTGELVENPDGTHTKYDSVFVATINEDGTVHFEDRPNLRVHLALPTPKGIRKRMKAWAEDPFGTSSGQLDPLTAHGIEDDDNDGKMDEGGVIPILGAGFDITDGIMRAIGDDPYSAKKAAFLERTFEERAEIGRKHRNDQLEHAEQFVLHNANELWDRVDLTAEQKRALLFELWDECAETGDDKLVDAGERARAALLRFISVELPSGSDDAYPAAEVRALNARRSSKQRFAPY